MVVFHGQGRENRDEENAASLPGYAYRTAPYRTVPYRTAPHRAVSYGTVQRARPRAHTTQMKHALWWRSTAVGTHTFFSLGDVVRPSLFSSGSCSSSSSSVRIGAQAGVVELGFQLPDANEERRSEPSVSVYVSVSVSVLDFLVVVASSGSLFRFGRYDRSIDPFIHSFHSRRAEGQASTQKVRRWRERSN